MSAPRRVGRPLKEHAHGTVLEHATAPPCGACAFRQARLDAGLTQAQAGVVLKLSLRTVHRWEAVITLPSIVQARREMAAAMLRPEAGQ